MHDCIFKFDNLQEMIPLKVTHVETDKTYIAFNCISEGI